MLKCVYMPAERAGIGQNLQKGDASNLQAGSMITAPFQGRHTALIHNLNINNSLYIHTQAEKCVVDDFCG